MPSQIKKVPLHVTIDEDVRLWMERTATEKRLSLAAFANSILAQCMDDSNQKTCEKKHAVEGNQQVRKAG